MLIHLIHFMPKNDQLPSLFDIHIRANVRPSQPPPPPLARQLKAACVLSGLDPPMEKVEARGDAFWAGGAQLDVFIYNESYTACRQTSHCKILTHDVLKLVMMGKNK